MAQNGSARSLRHTRFSTIQPAAPATTTPSDPLPVHTFYVRNRLRSLAVGCWSCHRAKRGSAATMPLTLTTTNGIAVVLPAGLADGDQVILAAGDVRAVLTVWVNFARKT